MAACTQEEGNSRETCQCFVDNLGENLTPEQLAVVADAVENSDDQAAQQRMQEQLGVNGTMAVAGAAKSCGSTG